MIRAWCPSYPAHREWRRKLRARLLWALESSNNSEAWKREIDSRWRQWESEQGPDWDHQEEYQP